MKKIISILLIAGFIMSFTLSNYAYALTQVPECESKSIVLINSQSGQILYEQNSEEKRIPASVTKLMTLMLIFEAIENDNCTLDDIVTASEYAASMGGTQIYLAKGEKMSVKELIIAIAIGSANDASVALAEYIAGSEEKFVQQMNEKAKELGMINTNFVNTNGLPAENHYTTAKDLSLLAQELVNEYPQILTFTSFKTYTLRENTDKPFVLYNKNKLLWWYEGADGLKTGWIGEESGYNVVATAQKENMRLIAVILGAEKTYGNFRDAQKLFDWGFENYTYQQFYAIGENVGQIAVEKGAVDSINVITGENIGILSEKNQLTQPMIDIVYNNLTAPIKKDDILGEVQISLNGEIINTYPIYAAENVEKYTFFQALKQMGCYLFC